MDIQALQFSLLAGRLFFKGVRYHGQNETILVHDGYITWRYWLRHVQKLEDEGRQGALRQLGPRKTNPVVKIAEEETQGRERFGGNTRSRDFLVGYLLKAEV